MKKTLEPLKNNGECIRYYTHAPNKNYGRIYPVNGGISLLSRNIRGSLLNGISTDIDCVNCHPVILLKICQDNNIECINLSYYIQNRDKCLKSLENLNRDEAKTAFIASMNSSHYIRKHKTNSLKKLIRK